MPLESLHEPSSLKNLTEPFTALYKGGYSFFQATSRLDSFDVEERMEKQKTDKCPNLLS